MVNQKVGLSYFSIDTDIELDDKISLIEAKHGSTGFTVIIKLLIKIYGDKGYYYKWNEKTKLIFSRRINIDYEKIDGIIKDAIDFELFDKKKFNKYGILTSKRIQEHYIEATKRRKTVELYKPFLVLNGQNDNLKRNNVRIMTENAIQFETNEMKGNEMRVNEIKKVKHFDFVFLTEEEYKKLIDKLGEDKTKIMIERLNGYIGQIGVKKASKKYVNHYHTILNWIRMEDDKKPKRDWKTT